MKIKKILKVILLIAVFISYLNYSSPALADAAPSIIGAELIDAGGYIADNIESLGTIKGSPEEKNIFAAGDDVVILLHHQSEVSVGDRLTIFRPPLFVTHPKTGKRVGMLFMPVGMIELKGVQGRDAVGRIIISYSYISPGDQIQPHRSVAPVTKIVQTDRDVSGYIVESQEGKMLNAEYGIVYLDRGVSDGIIPGTIFYVIGEDHHDVIGELRVISVQATTSTAIVIKSAEPFSIGSKVGTATTK